MKYGTKETGEAGKEGFTLKRIKILKLRRDITNDKFFYFYN